VLLILQGVRSAFVIALFAYTNQWHTFASWEKCLRSSSAGRNMTPRRQTPPQMSGVCSGVGIKARSNSLKSLVIPLRKESTIAKQHRGTTETHEEQMFRSWSNTNNTRGTRVIFMALTDLDFSFLVIEQIVSPNTFPYVSNPRTLLEPSLLHVGHLGSPIDHSVHSPEKTVYGIGPALNS
jgi:hypothetical protein